MPLGHLGEGTGMTFKEGDKTTAVTADKYFKKISMADETIAAIQVMFNEDATHTLVGTLYVQGSNLPNPTDEAAGANEWKTLDVSFDTLVTSGANGMSSINLSAVGWRWLRVFFDFTSGSGSMAVYTYVKTK